MTTDDVESISELTPVQEGILFHTLVETAAGVYHEQVGCALRGPLDADALERAWQAVVDHFDVLRTSFHWDDLDKPLQVVHRHVALSLVRLDWSDVALGDQPARVATLLREDRLRAFALDDAPLMRLTLVRLSDHAHRLVWTHHHLLLDGWSVPLVLSHVFRAYAALVRHETPRFAPGRPYRDYVAWLQRRDPARAAAWWRGQLAGFDAATPVLLEAPVRTAHESDGPGPELRVPVAITAQLRAMAQQHGLTVNTLVQGAFALVLARYAAQRDVVFGTTVAGRPADLAGVETMVGLFINTLPMRVAVDDGAPVASWLAHIQSTAAELRDFEWSSLVEIQGATSVPRGQPLFEAILVFENFPTDPAGAGALGGLAVHDVVLAERTNYPLALVAAPDAELTLRLDHDTTRFARSAAVRMLGHLEAVLRGVLARPTRSVGSLTLVTEAERAQLLVTWNDTRVDGVDGVCVHTLIEAQSARRPEAVALVHGRDALTWRALDAQAERFAQRLRARGVGTESRVGVCLERSVAMVVALLGVLKAGAAYVPIDPGYPTARQQLMVEDAGLACVVTQTALRAPLDAARVPVVCVDATDDAPGDGVPRAATRVGPDNAAYVIYTSGSTGRPKGVVVTHRNVANFFAAMDARLGCDPPGVWLAVTSISFDISVLELFWTLARGFRVVLQGEVATTTKRAPRRTTPLDFSLFYFANDEDALGTDKYRLLLDGARFADGHGFSAIWIPERHFHSFGGLYPNPSVLGAAIAAVTRHVGIRAGSVVLPLHDPLRVAEEWSVVDNLSHGRVGLSLASGWHADDFVLAPDDYAARRDVMLEGLETLRRLWRGESIARVNGAGRTVDVRVRPRPVQSELRVWLTAAGNPETFRAAGTRGAGLLTHLLGQDLTELERKVAIYRDAWRAAGHAGNGHVALMVHTFVHPDADHALRVVRAPFTAYLRSSVDLMRGLARSFGRDAETALSEQDLDAILEHAFDRYYHSSGLFGDPKHCARTIEAIRDAGVDEVACLIDFGIATDEVLAALPHLEALRSATREPAREADDDSLAGSIRAHGVTHLQATPSLLRLMLGDAPTAAALATVPTVLAGGEALPGPLAARLCELVPGRVFNMYGPTETTIWSAVDDVRADQPVTLGRPIANTQLYALDARGDLAPVGVVGELYIGGTGVTRGYLSRPALTAERFVPDPFGTVPGARMYRTGDLVRVRGDGRPEFLGRADQQLKLRGLRIEPSEIEAVLGTHPGVRVAVVVAREDTPGEPRLVAYWVPREADARATATALPGFVGERLPAHMVPSTFVELAALPLTPNGKLDRRALPAPSEAPATARIARAPRPGTETDVAAIWADVLGRESVGATDNFFELGGHSLLATRLVGRVRGAFGVALPLRVLFEAPTVEGLAALLDAGRRADTEAASIAIPHVERGGDLPVSFSQERLWVLDQLEPGSAVYNLVAALRFEGALDDASLERAVAEVTRRHEVLRATFHVVDGRLIQRITPAGNARGTFARDDVSGLASDARETAAHAHLATEARTGFDLSTGPLLRARLVRLAPDQHAFVVVLHHIAADGWSIALLIRELGALYAAFTAGQTSPLGEPAVQYVDYAAWQRASLTSATLDQHVAYFRDALAGAPPAIDLPTDRARPATPTFAGRRLAFTVPASTRSDLAALGRAEGATFFMTVFAGLAAFLARYVHVDDMVLGTPVANRPAPALEALIGCFVNTLAVRTRLAPGASFRQLVGHVRESLSDAFAHEDAPFDRVVDALEPARDRSRSPLFQVMLVFQSVTAAPVQLPGLALRPLDLPAETEKFDLTFELSEAAHGLDGTLSYATDLFDESTARQLAHYYTALLATLAAQPDATVERVSLLDAAERASIVTAWNATAVAWADEATVDALIGSWATATPEAEAVRGEDGTYTFAQLEAASNQLAHWLIARGVQAETRVGIYTPRTASVVVALLAVLKAGGAYVPLEIADPPARTAGLLADAGVSIVLTTSALQTRLPAGETLCLDAPSASLRAASTSRVARRVHPAQLAYVLYTSGSTGRPKGVMVPHAGFANYVRWARDYYAVATGEGAGAPVHSSLAFDLTITSLFVPLAAGRSVRLVAGDRGVDALAGVLREGTRFGLVKLTPAHLGLLAGALSDAQVQVGAFVVGGEALTGAALEPWARRAPGARLINEYGPTETVVGCSVYDAPPHETQADRAVPIGRPIANTRMYLLDAAGEPVARGALGEVYVGGAGVTRGYLGRPGQTAAAFVPDGLSGAAGARLYRTGDRARRRADGELEYVGRADAQVKVRGHRVELGEVEAALRAHPAVRDAAALVREDAPGDRRLAAYYVLAAGSEASPAMLREFVARTLPEAMLPAHFIALEALPLTPNGKVDRRALPAPSRADTQTDTAFEAPRTPRERLLADLWRDVLRVERVGIHDNFFELGGDSILAIHVATRARAAGLRVDPRHVFDHPDVASLAAATRDAVDLVVDDGPAHGPAVLGPAQRWFFEQGLAEPHHWNQSLILATKRRLDPAHLAAALRALIVHHDALRLRFVRAGDGWQASHAPVDAPHEVLAVHDLSAISPAERADSITRTTASASASLDLARGPLIRAALFDHGADEAGRLFVTVHHLVVDGVSWRILLEDLQTAYAQCESGATRVVLPPRTTSFQRWTAGLVAHAHDASLEAQLDAWAALAATTTVDGSTIDAREGSAERIEVALDARETSALLRDAHAAYRTQPMDLLLTALAQAVARWNGSRTLRLDLEGHGREALDDLDVARTVGWFTAIHPARLELPATDAPGVALRSIKEQLRAIPQPGRGFGMLRYLRDDAAAARLGSLPSADLSFNYFGQLDGALDASTLFAPAADVLGAARSPRARRPYALEFDTRVAAGCLRLSLRFDPSHHARPVATALAEGFATALRALIAHCTSPDAHGYTPSDFPLVRLDPTALDRLLGGRHGVEDVLPLTPLQRGMVFHDQLDPGRGVYIEQFRCTLDGEVDEEAFASAWTEVLRRIPVLRTAIASTDTGAPLQVVSAHVELPLVRVDLRADDAGAQLDALAAADFARGFDLASAPLMRLLLARTGSHAWQFVWTYHHVLLDGWSTALVFAELLEVYASLVAHRALPRVRTRPFRDHVAFLAREDHAAHEAFWRDTLDGFAEATPLPRVGPPRATGALTRHAERTHTLSTERTSALYAAARQARVTIGTLLHGAWGILLARYAGRDDVVFGTTVSGRSPELPGAEQIVGVLINTLPVRVRVAGREPVATWLGDLQARLAAMRAHEHAPLVEIQRGSDVPHGQPLFESLLVVENYAVDEAVRAWRGGFTVHTPAVLERTSYPLTLVCRPGERLELKLVYDADALDAADAPDALLAGLDALLDAMARTPTARVADLPLYRPDEQARLQTASRATRTVPVEACLHTLFAAQAARTPDAIAVEHEGATLSYAALSSRAASLAHALRARGVGPDVRVALCLERSLDLVVAVLGVVAAGGAYVPLDPAYPAARLAFALEDARPAVIVTTRALAARLPADAPVLALEALDGTPRAFPVVAMSPSNAAYVIYTSGSTGRPKGVVVTHANAVRLFGATRERFAFGAKDVWTLFHSYAFDFSVWELWGALLYGGRLVVVPYATSRAPDAFRALLARAGVTVLNQTPSAFAQLDAADAVATDAGLGALRLVIFGGEALAPGRLRAWFARHGDARPELVNMYGITETTVHVTARTIRSRDVEGVSPPSLVGAPLADLSLHVLDAAGALAPVGAAGELYVGGAGLARGYLGRPGLTASRFVPDPYAGVPGARLYRTGDRARRRADGDLEFLGRVDAQIKLRGHRIEPGEIEAALRTRPGVRDAAVVLRTDPGLAPRLVGYVVGPDIASLPALRASLVDDLPDVFVPGVLVALDALPLTVNGKLDRAALPAPAIVTDAAPDDVAPRTPTEQIVADVFADVLRIARVGASTHFFDAGGHSLLATQAVTRLRRVFGITLPFVALFEAPTVSALAARIDAARGSDTVDAPPIVPVDPTRPQPLSYAQERLWFLEQFEPGGTAYNVVAAVQFDGALDPEALARALEGLLARHAVLRTTYALIDGRPVQRVAPPEDSHLALAQSDVSSLPIEQREAAARELAAADAGTGFELRHGPVIRARLVRLASDAHMLVVVQHHIVSDGWSMGVMLRDLGALYAASVADAPVALAPLAVQYVDWAAWQRSWLTGSVLEAQLAYWREALAEPRATLDLPTDRPRPAVQTHAGATLVTTLPASLQAGLRALGRTEGATLFMTLLAGLATLVARQGGGDDVLVGTPVANRTRVETESLLGCFVNTLALRTRIDGAKTFADVLARARASALGGYAHQDAPFERVVDALAPTRDRSRTPLFQLMLVLQNAPLEPLALPGVALRSVEVETSSAQFDLTFEFAEAPVGLRCAVTYNTDLYDAGTIARFVRHFATLLDGAIAQPDAPLPRLPLLDAAERASIVTAWNATAVAWADEATVDALIGSWATATPEAEAVRGEDGTYTFAQLEAASNQLAHWLIARGVQAETRVGIYTPRTASVVVALLAVLKAGGAYVPLEIADPPARTAGLLADAGVSIVLTTSALQTRLPAGETLCLDAPSASLRAASTSRVARRVHPAQLAYVLYTSGSTGRPKGVMVPHAGFANYVRWARDYYAVATGEGAGAPVHSSLAFDLTITSLFVPLAAGRSVRLVAGDRGVDALAGVLREGTRFGLVKLTPAHLGLLAGALSDAQVRVGAFVVGGEALTGAALEPWARRAPGARLINEYGPTETVVGCSVYDAPPHETQADRAVPIGRPIANTRMYLLDAAGEPVARGALGEVYVGGAGVTRGYLGRPGQTAAAFVPDGLSGAAGARLYRTGDRARRRADGELEYVGRADAQVKVRGHRVELGEVEAALRAHPAVRDAAALVREDAPGDRRLVAYLVSRGAPLDPLEMRGHLAGVLPEYMVPSAFVVLDSLPITPNGKVDSRALPRPDAAALAVATYAPPQTATERALAAIWTEVLGVARVGLHDDFFALGGHSLLAMRVLAQIEARLGAAPRIHALFDAPTLGALAARVDAARDGTVAPPRIVPVARGPEGEAPMSFAQQRLWYLHHLAPESAFYNSAAAVQLEGTLVVAALERAVDEIVQRHEVLRTTFAVRHGEPVQRVAASLHVPVNHVDLERFGDDARREAERLSSEEARRPFDLAHGPLLRVTLFRFGPQRHALLLALHHIVVDGWSMGVFVREFAALYDAYLDGRASPLAPLPVQYADVAVWQRNWLTGPVLDAHLEYWTRQLAGIPSQLALPYDRPLPATPRFVGGRVSRVLPPDVLAQVHALARAESATLFMVMHAALATVLAALSAQEDIVVGTPVANRPGPELEGLIGFFVNSLVLRTRLDDDPTFTDLVRRTRGVTLDAYAHQQLPFEKLVDTLRARRDSGHMPIFQVLFVVQNAPRTALRLRDLTLAPAPAFAVETSKCSLQFYLEESPDGLAVDLVYDAEVFDETTAAAILARFDATTRTLVAAPATHVREAGAARPTGTAPSRRGRAAFAATKAQPVVPASTRRRDDPTDE